MKKKIIDILIKIYNKENEFKNKYFFQHYFYSELNKELTKMNMKYVIHYVKDRIIISFFCEAGTEMIRSHIIIIDMKNIIRRQKLIKLKKNYEKIIV